MSQQVTEWLDDLDESSFDKILPALDELEQIGPALRRPLVGHIEGSRHKKMKEVRSVGGHLRILFAFDPQRKAILLIAGDKEGQWDQWYKENIPSADDLYDQHLAGKKI